MRIQVRVINQATGQIKQIQGALQGLDTTMARSNATAGAFGRSFEKMPMEKWGKNLQWTGRQIEYNFTLPLALAAGAATKWALANETAMVRIQKVYGNANTTQQQMLRDTKALGRAFEALSSIYGIQQSAVLNIAADWAQAGASGAALAKQVRLTMDTMVLGEMDATKATTALIAIQSQYGLNTQQAIKTIAQLNMVENQTAISMQGLIEGFQRAAGSARAAGIDTRHLSALLAAMVPATGSAAQAGNGLRTMLSRLLAPTSQAADLLNQLGININTAGWQSKNGTQRLIELAQSFDKLTGGQKAVVSATIASRYQINRFDVLMRDILSPLGNYQRALHSTASDTKVMAQYHRELGQVLSSQPQAFKILYTQLQNALSRIIIPMLPAIIALVDKIVSMVTWFSNLNPHLQEFILAGVGIIAVVGPIIRYIGATALLLTELGKGARAAAIAFGILGVETEAADGSMVRSYNGIGKLLRLLATIPEFLYAKLVVPVADAFISIAASAGAGLLAIGRTVIAWGNVLLTAMQAALAPVFETVVTWLTALDTAFIAGFRAFLAAPVEALAALDEIVIVRLQVAWAAIVEWLAALDSAAIAGFQAFIADAVAWMAALDETVLVGLSGAFTTMVEWLAAIDEAAIAGFSAFLEAPMAALGALDEMFIAGLSRLWGSIVGIFSEGIGGVFVVMRQGLTAIVRFALVTIPKMFGPWGIAIFAVIALVSAFSDNIKKAFADVGDFVLRVFNALPQGIQNAFIAVISVVRSAVETIVGWMKELNPFQRHSPSLVDNVERGHHVIAKNYHQMSTKVAAHVSSATDALGSFNDATRGARTQMENEQFASVRKDVVAAAPGAGPAFDKMVQAIKALEATLPTLTAEISAQQSVVDKWQKSLDAANSKLSTAQDRLKALQAVADAAKSKLDADQQSLQNLASTPIKGMKDMQDQIFANTMAQKKLQLQLMQMEDAVGPIDKLQAKMSSLQGDIDKLKGEEASLRSSGAGSDILATYDQQISALQAQQQAITASTAPMQALQDQLAALQRQGQELDLQNSLQFDPLTKQIQDMVDTTKEMPFDKIVDGITKTQTAVAKDQTSYDAATKAVTRQQAVVDALTKSRDALQKRYDAENAKLSALKNQYDANTQAIQNMKSAMDDFVQSANAAAAASKKSKGTPLDAAFAGAAKGGFPDPGGKGINFTGGGDINKLADQWIAESKKAFGNFDMFAPFKDMFKKFWDWLNHVTGGFASRAVDGMKKHLGASLAGAGIGALIGEAILGPFGLVLGAGIGAVAGNALGKVDWHGVMNSVTSTFTSMGKSISDSGFGKAMRALGAMVEKIIKIIVDAWNYLAPDIRRIGHEIWDFLSGLTETVIKEFRKWSDLAKPAVEAFGHIWHVAQDLFNFLLPIFKLGVGAILLVWKIALPFLVNIIKPIFDLIIALVKRAINFLHDIIKFVLDLINGDWSAAFGDLLHVAEDTLGAVYDVFKSIFGEVYGVVKSIVENIVRFFKWLYDELWGHSILKDIHDVFLMVWHAIGNTLAWVWKNVIVPVFDAFKSVWRNVLKKDMEALQTSFSLIWHGIGDALSWVWNKVITPVWNAFKSVWKNVLSKDMNALQTAFSAIWNGIGNGLSWVYNHVISPVWDALQSVWTKVLRPGLSGLVTGIFAVWNAVGSGIAKGVNIGIDAINALIGGLNWIGSHVPGLKFHVDTLAKVKWSDAKPPKFAEGGFLATGHGFRTHGARAIVGEGDPRHPEYVIPTDPKYRNNALRLLASLLGDMHHPARSGSYAGQTGGGIPGYDGGGILGALEGAASSAWNTAKGVGEWIRKGAVTAAMAPFLKAFDEAVKIVPNGVHERDMLLAWKNNIYNWLKGTDQGHQHKNPDYKPGTAPASGLSQKQPSSPDVRRWTGAVGDSLVEMQRSISFIPAVLRRIGLESGGDPRVVNKWDSNWKAGHPSVGLMQVTDGTFAAYAGKYRHQGPFLYGVSVNPKANIWAALHYAESRYGNIGNIDPLVHPGGYAGGGILGVPSLAQGAYIKRRAGGILVRVGEGATDEIVKPIPRGSDGRDGDLHFHGDLSFPNITDPNDADQFIKNLRSLGRK